MSEEKKIDVSKEACDNRIAERMAKEVKVSKIFYIILSVIMWVSFVAFVVLLILPFAKSGEFKFPIGVCVILLVSAGLSVAIKFRIGKLKKMTVDEYMDERLKEIALNDTDTIRCPRCGCEHITYQKKGFSGAKAFIGMSLIGVYGVFFGVPGKDKIRATCVKCGRSWIIKKK